MTASPAIGVVVRAHNVAPYLAASIESVLSQDPPPREVVVVDDGSTDGTGSVADSFSPRVKVVHQERRGPGGAVNGGVVHLSSDLLAFQDGDDLWTPGRLAAMVEAIEAEPAWDGVMGRVLHFASEDLEPDEAARFAIPVEPQSGAALPSLLLRRAALDRVGLFDESLRAGEYLEWHDRALRKGIRIEPIECVCLRRRVHRSNTTRSPDARRDYLKVARLAIGRHRSREGGSA
jgi:glycosyltransferase involved in cell wall biosynthesis